MTRFVSLLFILLMCAQGWCSAGPLQEDGSLLSAGNVETTMRDIVETGDLAKVKALVEKNPSLAKVPGGMQRAVMLNRLDIVKYLLSKGADVNVNLGNGETPLMQSCGRGDSLYNITEFLIDQGASVKKKDDWGRSVLVYAIRGCEGSPEMARSTPPTLEIIKLLFSKGAQVNTADKGGMTPLMADIQGEPGLANCNPVIVKLLMEQGADVNARDEKGRTAIAIALDYKTRWSKDSPDFAKRVDECILLLRKAGAK
jgi:hypothetical protein